MFGNINSAFILSLIAHLCLLFAVGALLPNFVGDNRIFRVNLVSYQTLSAGVDSSLQPEAVPDSQGSAAIKAHGSLPSPSSPPTGELHTDDIKPTHPVEVSVRTCPLQTKPVVARTHPVRKEKVAVAQNIPTGDESAANQGKGEVRGDKTSPMPDTASTSAHPAPGSTDKSIGMAYFSAVVAKIEAAKRYPQTAIRRRLEGNVEVNFRLAANGALLAVDLVKSSGYHSLDEAAIAAVNRAAPFPQYPESIKNIPESLKITISFILTLRNGG